jgi:hypothetical protein
MRYVVVSMRSTVYVLLLRTPVWLAMLGLVAITRHGSAWWVVPVALAVNLALGYAMMWALPKKIYTEPTTLEADVKRDYPRPKPRAEEPTPS